LSKRLRSPCERLNKRARSLTRTQVRIDGERGLVAYMEWIAEEHPVTACAMLARIMPQQTEHSQTVDATYHSFEEINNRPRELGLPVERIYPIARI